jgi:hypothetical protein
MDWSCEHSFGSGNQPAEAFLPGFSRRDAGLVEKGIEAALGKRKSLRE